VRVTSVPGCSQPVPGIVPNLSALLSCEFSVFPVSLSIKNQGDKKEGVCGIGRNKSLLGTWEHRERKIQTHRLDLESLLDAVCGACRREIEAGCE
jgi:hypothetical protein